MTRAQLILARGVYEELLVLDISKFELRLDIREVQLVDFLFNQTVVVLDLFFLGAFREPLSRATALVLNRFQRLALDQVERLLSDWLHRQVGVHFVRREVMEILLSLTASPLVYAGRVVLILDSWLSTVL